MGGQLAAKSRQNIEVCVTLEPVLALLEGKDREARWDSAAATGGVTQDPPCGRAQVMGVLRQAEGGIPVPELCREHGISSATFYKWRAKYGGMDASMMSQMKSLEDENRRLKRMFADLSMQADLLREALGKK